MLCTVIPYLSFFPDQAVRTSVFSNVESLNIWISSIFICQNDLSYVIVCDVRGFSIIDSEMVPENCDNMQIHIESVPKSLTGSDVSLSIKRVEPYTHDILSHCVDLHYQYQHGCRQLVFTTVNDSRSTCIVLFQPAFFFLVDRFVRVPVLHFTFIA